MTLTELVEHVATKTGKTKADVKAVLDAFTETVETTALAGETVKLSGFGVFSKKEIKARKIRPEFGGGMSDPRTTIKFKASKKDA